MYSQSTPHFNSTASGFADYIEQRGHRDLADKIRRRLPIWPRRATNAKDEALVREFKEELKRFEREEKARAMKQQIQAAMGTAG